MNKLIIGFVFVLILGGAVWMVRPDASSESANIAQEVDFDFGTISMSAGKVNHVFSVPNDGVEPLAILQMYTSCMCTTATLTVGENVFGPVGMPGHGAVPKFDAVILPGDQGSVEVIFDPTAHGPAGVGKISRVVTLETGDGTPIEFSFAANVTP